MNKLDQNWFSEICEVNGSAYSMQITEKLESVTTDFQTIDIYQTTNFGKLMTIDGFVMLTSKDNFLYHEMMTHPILFTHKNPKNVAIIGGGDCGTLKEVLKHDSVESVIQIEIDEQVTRLAEVYFPELCSSNNDSRAELLFADGIKWMQQAAENSLDLIIVDSTDPVGPAEGLFTEDFYRNCARALREDGMLCQQGESPIIHLQLIKDVQAAMTNAGFKHTHLLNFPQPCYPSGWWCAQIASLNQSLFEIREDAIRNIPFPTEYYNLDVHKGALAMPSFVARELK